MTTSLANALLTYPRGGIQSLTLNQVPRSENPSVESYPEAILEVRNRKFAKNVVCLTKPSAMEVRDSVLCVNCACVFACVCTN